MTTHQWGHVAGFGDDGHQPGICGMYWRLCHLLTLTLQQVQFHLHSYQLFEPLVTSAEWLLLLRQCDGQGLVRRNVIFDLLGTLWLLEPPLDFY